MIRGFITYAARVAVPDFWCCSGLTMLAVVWRKAGLAKTAGPEPESRRWRPALCLASGAAPALARGVGRRNSRSLPCVLHGAACWRSMRRRLPRKPPRTAPVQPTSVTPESRRRRLMGAGAASTTQDVVQSTSVGTKYSGLSRGLKKVYLLLKRARGVDFCGVEARQGLARNAVASQRERPYAGLGRLGNLAQSTG